MPRTSNTALSVRLSADEREKLGLTPAASACLSIEFAEDRCFRPVKHRNQVFNHQGPSGRDVQYAMAGFMMGDQNGHNLWRFFASSSLADSERRRMEQNRRRKLAARQLE
jgi:hypothetical protein